MPTLALFDLDNTLLDGDSDASWNNFLFRNGYITDDKYNVKNQQFHQHYMRGQLDMKQYIRFISDVLNSVSKHNLHALREHYLEQVVRPMVLAKGEQLVAQHKKNGDCTILISATNSFIVGAVARLFAIDYWMATDLGVENGTFTGEIDGLSCYQHGKVEKMQHWLQQHDEYSLQRAFFYSDSVNDIPLLENVSSPIAVDPDEPLRAHAIRNDWKIISLR